MQANYSCRRSLLNVKKYSSICIQLRQTCKMTVVNRLLNCLHNTCGDSNRNRHHFTPKHLCPTYQPQSMSDSVQSKVNINKFNFKKIKTSLMREGVKWRRKGGALTTWRLHYLMTEEKPAAVCQNLNIDTQMPVGYQLPQLVLSSSFLSLSFFFFFCLSSYTGRRLFFTNFCSVPPSIGFPVHNHQSPSVWHIFYHFYSPIFTISRSYSFLLPTTTRTLLCFFPWRSLCSQLFFWK